MEFSHWAMLSYGPDIVPAFGRNRFIYYPSEFGDVGEFVFIPYDPTNGTVSEGDIIYRHTMGMKD